jgi:hypothetical protein
MQPTENACWQPRGPRLRRSGPSARTGGASSNPSTRVSANAQPLARRNHTTHETMKRTRTKSSPPPPVPAYNLTLEKEGAGLLRLYVCWADSRPLFVAGELQRVLEELWAISASPAAAESTFISDMVCPAVRSLADEQRHAEAGRLLDFLAMTQLPGATARLGETPHGELALGRLRASLVCQAKAPPECSEPTKRARTCSNHTKQSSSRPADPERNQIHAPISRTA